MESMRLALFLFCAPLYIRAGNTDWEIKIARGVFSEMEHAEIGAKLLTSSHWIAEGFFLHLIRQK